MTEHSCMQMLKKKHGERKHACIGLDTRLEEISATGHNILEFNKAIIRATKDIVCAYKPNLGFYLADGIRGLYALRETVEFSHTIAPGVPVILDGKFGDIGLSAAQYAKFAFEQIGADAVTVNPWCGLADGIDAFLECKNKGIFVWCRGSNKGSAEFQDLEITTVSAGALYDQPLYERVAEDVSGFNEYGGPRIKDSWNTNLNCGIVVGATYPEQLARIRRVVGDMPILIPGVGAQHGDLEKSVRAALYTDFETGEKTFPAIINSSRGIIYASSGEDFAEAARKKTLELNRQIRKTLKEEGV